MRLWTFEQSRAAVPYIASILRSVREHLVEGQAQQRLLTRLEEKAGRPTRETLIGQDEARKAAARAKDEYRKAVAELSALDVVVHDPLQGVALVPFLHDEQLAWFVYDMHDANGMRFWRYHSDSDDTRRRLTAAQTR
ncbi:MAG: DUF2203 family protein [Gemmataceae bacterium]